MEAFTPDVVHVALSDALVDDAGHDVGELEVGEDLEAEAAEK